MVSKILRNLDKNKIQSAENSFFIKKEKGWTADNAVVRNIHPAMTRVAVPVAGFTKELIHCLLFFTIF